MSSLSQQQVYYMCCCNNQLEVVNGQYTNGALRMLCPHFKWNLHGGIQRFAMHSQFRFLIEILAKSQFFFLFCLQPHSCFYFMNPPIIYFRFLHGANALLI